jgi:hypothetical protein
VAERLNIQTGTRFGRLTVVQEAEPYVTPGGSQVRKFFCTCDCGGETAVTLTKLRNGHTKSCGCLRVETTRKSFTTHGHCSAGDQSAYYDLWCTIKSKVVSRCHKSAKACLHISMYQPWVDDFTVFYSYLIENLGPRPSGHSLDRINTWGNYEPGNVRWATARQQAQNTRRSRYITYKGETRVLSEWARLAGISPSALYGRVVQHGWPMEKAMTTPIRKRAAE